MRETNYTAQPLTPRSILGKDAIYFSATLRDPDKSSEVCEGAAVLLQMGSAEYNTTSFSSDIECLREREKIHWGFNDSSMPSWIDIGTVTLSTSPEWRFPSAPYCNATQIIKSLESNYHVQYHPPLGFANLSGYKEDRVVCNSFALYRYKSKSTVCFNDLQDNTENEHPLFCGVSKPFEIHASAYVVIGALSLQFIINIITFIIIKSNKSAAREKSENVKGAMSSPRTQSLSINTCMKQDLTSSIKSVFSLAGYISVIARNASVISYNAILTFSSIITFSLCLISAILEYHLIIDKSEESVLVHTLIPNIMLFSLPAALFSLITVAVLYCCYQSKITGNKENAPPNCINKFLQIFHSFVEYPEVSFEVFFVVRRLISTLTKDNGKTQSIELMIAATVASMAALESLSEKYLWFEEIFLQEGEEERKSFEKHKKSRVCKDLSVLLTLSNSLMLTSSVNEWIEMLDMSLPVPVSEHNEWHPLCENITIVVVFLFVYTSKIVAKNQGILGLTLPLFDTFLSTWVFYTLLIERLDGLNSFSVGSDESLGGRHVADHIMWALPFAISRTCERLRNFSAGAIKKELRKMRAIIQISYQLKKEFSELNDEKASPKELALHKRAKKLKQMIDDFLSCVWFRPIPCLQHFFWEKTQSSRSKSIPGYELLEDSTEKKGKSGKTRETSISLSNTFLKDPFVSKEQNFLTLSGSSEWNYYSGVTQEATHLSYVLTDLRGKEWLSAFLSINEGPYTPLLAWGLDKVILGLDLKFSLQSSDCLTISVNALTALILCVFSTYVAFLSQSSLSECIKTFNRERPVNSSYTCESVLDNKVSVNSLGGSLVIVILSSTVLQLLSDPIVSWAVNAYQKLNKDKDLGENCFLGALSIVRLLLLALVFISHVILAGEVYNLDTAYISKLDSPSDSYITQNKTMLYMAFAADAFHSIIIAFGRFPCCPDHEMGCSTTQKRRGKDDTSSPTDTDKENSGTSPPCNIPGLSFQKVARDGHCFYHAAGRYLGEEQGAVRNRVYHHMRGNVKKWKHVIEARRHKSAEKYLENVKSGGNEWATQVEIEALMMHLERPIVVIGDQNKIVLEDGLERFPDADPIFVYYWGAVEQHYDALLVIDEAQLSGRKILDTLLKKNRPEKGQSGAAKESNASSESSIEDGPPVQEEDSASELQAELDELEELDALEESKAAEESVASNESVTSPSSKQRAPNSLFATDEGDQREGAPLPEEASNSDSRSQMTQ